MAGNIADIYAACRSSSSADELLALLLKPGVATEVAHHIRERGPSKEVVGLLERCFQALRKGSLHAAGLTSGQDGEAEEDDNGEQQQMRLEKVMGTLFKAAVAIMGGDGDDAESAAYPSLLQENVDLLNFKQLAALLSEICRTVEGGSRGAVRMLQLLPRAATQLLAMGAPEDEAEEDAALEAAVGGGRGAAGGGPASAAANHVGTALHRLTHAEWIPERRGGGAAAGGGGGGGTVLAVPIMEALREVPMTPAQLRAVVLRCLSACGG
ncbi:hypothetical protein Agub_g8796, partial [Astrephomene gubernaculifera]